MLENLKMAKGMQNMDLIKKCCFYNPPPHMLKITGVNEIQFYNKF